MSTKKRLAIVAGDIKQHRFLALFEILKNEFDTTLFLLEDESQPILYESGIKARLFPKVPDMPGFLQNLESEIGHMDGIIGIETSRLSTFQAIRAARKFRIPAGVVVTESQPLFYEKYHNIRAVQYDICRSADLFWTTSEASRATLNIEGVTDEKIFDARPPIISKFKYKHELRQKFRAYIGMRAEDILLLCPSALEHDSNLEIILESLRQIKLQGIPAALRLKLMFIGDGSAARDLKLKAVEKGLGSSVMFLHQNPEPFICDLLCAADFIILSGAYPDHTPQEFPLGILEAMGTGNFPLVPAGSVAAQILGSQAMTYSRDHVSSLTTCIFRALNAMSDPTGLRLQISDFIHKTWNSVDHQQSFLQSVQSLVTSSSLRCHNMPTLSSVLQEIEGLIKSGKETDALVMIAEMELNGLPSSSSEAELARLKGDCHYNLGAIHDAFDSYTRCMHLDPHNPYGLRGLGFIAWHGHSNEEALTFFKRALATLESDVLSFYGIGLVYRRLGLLEEALYWLERCVLVQGAPPSANIALAQTCAQFTPRSRGIQALQKTIEVVGEQKALLSTLGQLYLAEGLVEKGNELMRQALEVTTKPAA